ncbi:MAG: ornithine cyclodeaminase family protein [Actinomycetota bacterium]
MLVLGRADVEKLLDTEDLIEALGPAMVDLSEGRVSMPPRIAAQIDEREAFLAAMPAFLPGLGALETKLVSVFPHNRDRPSHQAVIVCFDPENGTPLALMDATHVTAMRTAAGSALATRLLARGDAKVLAIVGTGVQARAHARAVPLVRSFERTVIAGRDPSKTKDLARELGAEATPDYETAVSQADVVCACTHSPEPVIRRAWLREGTHVNSVGYTPGVEIDAETVADALVVVESRASALAPLPAGANELLWPIRDGMIGEDHVHAEIGELVAGTRPGRTSNDQITLYKSVGVAVQDAVAASLVLEAARRVGAGTEIDL